MTVLENEIKPGEVHPNIASMLIWNAEHFASKHVLQYKENGEYTGITWSDFYRDILKIIKGLKYFGYTRGDKVLIYSKNSLRMLQLELALMSSGGVSVPIFFNYNGETAESLTKHSDAKFLAAGERFHLDRINPDNDLKQVFSLDDTHDSRLHNLTPFKELLSGDVPSPDILDANAGQDDVCLNMYTSGTMGNQKCVQLTHRNILSQQAALRKVWDIDGNDRFLSYLRWHHSFGGIFEKFTALYNGATLALESSQGLDPNTIFKNWMLVKPTVFFSVPLIYQALTDITLENKQSMRSFFHPDLKFVFTAAAPLPQHISDLFEKRKIPVIEGWGLTETSPCCTLTDPKIKREPGVVGMPIPGVSIRVSDDSELQVKGPNVMPGYYKNDAANLEAFTEDGWFCTGDIGELAPGGIRLITRKDRIFKLSNAEKVIPTELEAKITGKCHFISYVLVEGNGKNYPVALLFPDKRLLDENSHDNIEIEGCSCPANLTELSVCLKGCLNEVNSCLKQKFSRIKAAMLIDDTLNVENRTLTPSMKMAPNSVKSIYRSHIEKLYGSEEPVNDDVYVIFLDEQPDTNSSKKNV